MDSKVKKKQKDVKVTNTIKNASTTNSLKGVKNVKLNSKFTTLTGQKVTRQDLIDAMKRVDFCAIYSDGGNQGDNKSMITGADIRKALDVGILTKEDINPVQYKAIKKIRLDS